MAQALAQMSQALAQERIREWTSGPLDLTHMGLMELPELPAGITGLNCSGNELLKLPDALPAGLEWLQCSNNHLYSLPETLPAGLTELYCSGNQGLTELPELP
ncbi:MAG: hypothetical protein EBT07_16095, partial [Actinobacteria bacterium]|nr:hypothetical protein [Actinomycetota bacterium]